MRRGKEKYQCQQCTHWFQINRTAPRVSPRILTLQHLAGTPFRSLGLQYDIGSATAYRRVQEILTTLPLCIDVTRTYCTQFSGILLVDGKYVAVKGYDRKIPVLYGVDYMTHDIPHMVFSIAENYQTCSSFFHSLAFANYPLQAVVCDDNQNIYQTAQWVYPHTAIQLCHVHYLRSVRTLLDPEHHLHDARFFGELCTLFVVKRSIGDFQGRARILYERYRHILHYRDILLDLERRQALLLGYHAHRNTPTTTNLIESLNSHLQGRLDTIKGFESFQHAQTWLNGYFLKRRITPFTDCTRKFHRLNGKTRLSQTQKAGIEVPTFF